MTIQVVGAGLGRTGTNSLKLALEHLLGGPCYHMVEVFGRPGDAEVWADAYEGRPPDWHEFLRDFRAVVDWPAVSFWADLATAFPDAVILLSVRDADAWWTSASNTIFQALAGSTEPDRMVAGMMASFPLALDHPDAAKAAYEAHNQHVRDPPIRPAWSSGAPGTDGHRSARRWAWPCPTSRSPTSTPPPSSGPPPASTSPMRPPMKPPMKPVDKWCHRG